MALFRKPTAPIYGMVGYLQFTVETDGDDEGFLYRFASERHKRLEDEIRAQVRETLGADFEVLNVRLDRGSVHIWIALGAVGTFFMGFSRLRELCEERESPHGAAQARVRSLLPGSLARPARYSYHGHRFVAAQRDRPRRQSVVE